MIQSKLPIRRNFSILIFSILFFTNIDALYAGNDWLSEEVLNQLQELRKEVKSMRSEIADLKDEISHLKVSSDSVGDSSSKSVKLEEDPFLGNQDTKIAIVEFSDFECPYCTRHNKQTLPQLKDSYIKTGQVQYVMKDFPLDAHRLAQRAAIAANCARQQGQYESMRNTLFESRSKLGDEFYISEAQKLGLYVCASITSYR